jgi:hypothetical protein
VKKLVLPLLLTAVASAGENQALDSSNRETHVKTQVFEPQQGSGLNFFGDFLYWKATEDNITLFGKESVPVDRMTTFKFAHLDFHFDSGFRLGGGYHFKDRRWNIGFSWTRFHTGAKASVKRNPGERIFSFLGLPGNVVGRFEYESAKQKWHLHYDMLDLWLTPDKIDYLSFSFQPIAGLRGGWIDQKISFFGPISSAVIPPGVFEGNTVMKQDFKTIGISLGFNTRYETCCGLGLFGDFLGALVYGRFDNHHYRALDGIPGGGPFADNIREKFNCFRPNLQFALGLDWNKTFYNERLNCAIYAAYEQVYWFNQNQFFAFFFEEGATPGTNPIQDPRRFSGDLSFGGLTVGAKLAF